MYIPKVYNLLKIFIKYLNIFDYLLILCFHFSLNSGESEV